MARYMHGTTAQGLADILKGNGKAQGPWNCCDRDGFTYLWDVEALLEGEGYEDDHAAIQQAFESAQVQAAIAGDDTTLYVLEVELDADTVAPDQSCENMPYAVVVRETTITRDIITKAWAVDFSKWDAPFVLAALVGRDYFEGSSVTDERLVALAEALSEQGVFREELLEFDWYETTLPA